MIFVGCKGKRPHFLLTPAFTGGYIIVVYTIVINCKGVLKHP